MGSRHDRHLGEPIHATTHQGQVLPSPSSWGHQHCLLPPYGGHQPRGGQAGGKGPSKWHRLAKLTPGPALPGWAALGKWPNLSEPESPPFPPSLRSMEGKCLLLGWVRGFQKSVGHIECAGKPHQGHAASGPSSVGGGRGGAPDRHPSQVVVTAEGVRCSAPSGCQPWPPSSALGSGTCTLGLPPTRWPVGRGRPARDLHGGHGGSWDAGRSPWEPGGQWYPLT